jgi:lipoprotein-anchoring transpeptidase ErfK/SrfK
LRAGYSVSRLHLIGQGETLFQMAETMISRRILLGAVLTAPLAACQTGSRLDAASSDAMADAGWYIGSLDDEPFDIPLVDRRRMKPEFERQVVEYAGSERPGTIVVDIDDRFLYLVQPGGQAIRYGIGVGRQGFSWRGVAYVGRKGVWPAWSPTRTMVSLKPELPRYRDSGLDNPLGARALYLYQNGGDTLVRIHGTNEPWSIGEQVSSGCVRMLNEDVLDLYNRVPVGTTVLVRRNGRWRV